MSTRGFVIYTHVAEGHPSGLKIITKSNWSGIGLYIPRNRFSPNKSRAELQKPGVYMLLGDLDFDPRIYVGEGDPLLDRLISHQTKKDFWDVLIAFTSNDSSLNKAIIQYLESRLCSLAAKTSRFKIDNKNVPKAPSLSQMDTDVAEGFLAELLLCLPILGISLDTPSKTEASKENYLSIKNSKGAQAKGVLTDDGFLVFKDSKASLEETPSFPSSLKAKRTELIERGVLKDTGQGYYEFTCDYLFGSPSTAAGIVQGRSANGRIDWKGENDTPLKELEKKD